MRNASGQQVENERQWKKKANRNTSNKMFCVHNDIFSIKNVTKKIRVASTAAKNVQSCCCLQIRPIHFFCLSRCRRRSALTDLTFVWVNHKYINKSFACRLNLYIKRHHRKSSLSSFLILLWHQMILSAQIY